MVAPRFIAAELLKKRRQDKEKAKNTVLNSADIHVLGSHCQGQRPSLLVNSEGSAYLFNCGEGIQRHCYANRVRLSNLEHLFVTNNNWSNLSGAYGLSLTLQDIGIPNFTLHGSEGIIDFFKSVSSFLSFNTGIVCRTEVCNGNEYKDSCISISSVILDASARHMDSKRLKKASTLISYICKLPDLPGSLDPRKCSNLQVPIGPKLAMLKSGCDITLDDGTIVKSSDVCGPKNRGMHFIVLDCPTVCDIDLVVKNETLNLIKALRLESDREQIDMVFHFAPKEVYSDHSYSEWMSSFPDDCKHIMLSNEQSHKPNLIDSYRLQHLLHQIDRDLFPNLNLPKNIRTKMEQELAEVSDKDLEYGSADPDESDLKYHYKGELSDQERIYHASALDKFIIRPRSVLYAAEARLLLDVTYKAASMLPDFDELFEAYDSWRALEPSPNSYEPEIVFLGTGSALPSKLRNTSCILINLTTPKPASIIMDCGEGSYAQMVRFYGETKTNDLLSHVKMIYVSHHHADHHIGLIEILRRIKMTGRHDSLLVLIPPGIETHLNYYNQNFEDLSPIYTLVSTQSLKMNPTLGSKKDDYLPMINLIRKKSDNLVDDIKVVAVEHCINACAITIVLNLAHPEMKQFKLSYSGDARPSENFINIGRGSDLLIHEATFDHREKMSALEKKHCTTSEAIDVSKGMKAKYTILTHFSQRYPKIPYFTDKFDDSIGYAFDNMSFKYPSQCPRLPKMKDILRNVFSKSLSEIDARRIKMMDRKTTVSNILHSGASTS